MSLCHSDQRARVHGAKAAAEDLRMVVGGTVIEPDDGPRSGYQLELTLVDVDALPWQVAQLLGEYELDAPISQRRGAAWTVVATA